MTLGKTTPFKLKKTYRKERKEKNVILREVAGRRIHATVTLQTPVGFADTPFEKGAFLLCGFAPSRERLSIKFFRVFRGQKLSRVQNYG
ncbi:MAG: hypothetical protein FWC38_02035 [Proteobacteria bacterium]|nr:hypothetical protein [Pseudomonadota bacterium]MCL2307020.1 hypothetical protein [Pseudomonadota bacterium]